VPYVLDGANLRDAHRFLAFVVIFVSITAITGFSGLLTLGQASIAGLGAFATARLTAELDVPVLVAMVPGVGIATLAGLVAAWPALKRRAGRFLGLAPHGRALIIYPFVFNARLPVIVGGPGMMRVERPHLLGLDLSGDTAFWYFELVVVVLVLALVNNLRRGPLGRVLSSLRDSETAASSVGIDLRMTKLFVFGVSATVAGLGGVLLTQADQSWDAQTFYPVFGLFWLTAVMVCGVASIRGAVLAAALYVAVPAVTGQDVQSAVGLFGIGCLFLGHLPGGLVAQAGRVPELVQRRLTAAWQAAVAGAER
jgi:branched-chain amino acid transport system permease protein